MTKMPHIRMPKIFGDDFGMSFPKMTMPDFSKDFGNME